MSIRSIHCFVLGFTLLILGGCYTTQEEDPEIIVTLDPEFTVDLYEERAPADGSPTFGLWMESKAEYACSNVQIEAITQVTGKTIEVQMLEIRQPDSCQSGPGPARGFLPIGALANGTYTFRLSLNPVIINTGTLYVQDGRYELSLSRQQGVDFQNRVLETLQEGYLWGYALTPDEQQQPTADLLVQQLKGVSQDANLPAGFYGYFTVSGTGQYFFHRSIAPAGTHKPFLRRLGNTHPDVVKAILQSYRNHPANPLEVLCWSTAGIF
ncbi:MAG: hypothetical protein EP344_14380 [Bacteroidetes bacterium]|nr:MAG: hypothetical protein EP344_14380 [Bacteroidota bacterium]